MDGLYGYPSLIGIYIDNAKDVVRIENIHFWGGYVGTQPNIWAYVENNGVGIVSYRNDNPFFSRLFFLEYFKGISFSTSSYGITSRPQISQMQCDFCRYGIVVDGAGVKGMLVNELMVFAGSVPSPQIGVFIDADNVTAILSDLDIAGMGANAIRVEGSNTVVHVSNAMVRSWNKSGAGFPAFEAFPASSGTTKLYVRDSVVGNGGSPAPPTCSSSAVCSTVVSPDFNFE